MVDMIHVRETRSSSSELKFILTPALALSIRQWLRSELQPDPHGAGPCRDEYDTSSVYFDTLALDVFNRRRSFGRAKYRIRRYAPSGAVFLERKLRKPGMLVKRRSMTTLEDLAKLAAGHVEPAWIGAWFQRRLLVRELRPVSQISFQRTARVLAGSDGVARATLDTGFSAVALDALRFEPGRGLGFLRDAAILELKFRGRPPAAFRRLLEEFALAPQTASKYRLGMTALGHAPVVPATVRPDGAGVSYA
jgi:hypothetical protein